MGCPPGSRGKITLTNPHLTGGPSVVVISYNADEVPHYYGQLLATRCHSTNTYIRSRGRWWQLASQVKALPRAIEGLPAPQVLAREYAGTYALTSEIHLTVTVSDSGIAVERPGRPSQRLFALDERVFIRHIVRGFWVFQRDVAGAVTQLINWRDNNPVVWQRAP